MNKQELICELNSQKDKPTVNYFTLEKREGYQEGMRIAKFIAEKLDEPQKVKLPPCVAAWIKWNKKGRGGSVFVLFDIDKAIAFEEHQKGKGLLDWMIDHRNHDILIRAWLDGYEVEEEPKWTVNEGDLVVRRGEHETKIYFVEAVHEDGILLVNGIKDEFFTDLVDRSIDEESVSYFYKNFRLLAKKENLEVEKV